MKISGTAKAGYHRPDAKYCSLKCRKITGRPKTSPEIEITCKFCQKTYMIPEGQQSNRVFCSTECYYNGQRAGMVRKMERNATEEKACEACGTIMIIGNRSRRDVREGTRLDYKPPRTRFCSIECAHKPEIKERICIQCKTAFVRSGNGQPKYCSRQCEAAWRGSHSSLPIAECKACGNMFQRARRQAGVGNSFCSVKCRMVGRLYPRGKAHHLFKGKGESRGYLWTTDDSEERTSSGKLRRRLVHVIEVEKHLNRRLDPETELVHHVNLDKRNNHLDNLLVMTPAEHHAVHYFYQTEFVREHEARGDLLAIVKAFLATLRSAEAQTA